MVIAKPRAWRSVPPNAALHVAHFHSPRSWYGRAVYRPKGDPTNGARYPGSVVPLTSESESRMTSVY